MTEPYYVIRIEALRVRPWPFSFETSRTLGELSYIDLPEEIERTFKEIDRLLSKKGKGYSSLSEFENRSWESVSPNRKVKP